MKTDSEVFFEMVCEFNPYFSSLMDVDNPKLPNYKKENIENIIKSLNNIQNKVRKNGFESTDDKILLMSINPTKFFFENEPFWNNPAFYSVNLQISLEVCFNCYSVINRGKVKTEILKKRFRILIRIFIQLLQIWIMLMLVK